MLCSTTALFPVKGNKGDEFHNGTETLISSIPWNDLLHVQPSWMSAVKIDD